MSHFVALCTEFVAWSEETANIMSDKDPAPEEVRHTSAFTMIEGQSMDHVLDNTAHQAHDDTESDSSDGDSTVIRTWTQRTRMAGPCLRS